MAMKKNGRKATRDGIQRALLRLRRNRSLFITCAALDHDAPNESTFSGNLLRMFQSSPDRSIKKRP
jgi:hypothetical protein